jgi:hypothetical protein
MGKAKVYFKKFANFLLGRTPIEIGPMLARINALGHQCISGINVSISKTHQSCVTYHSCQEEI